MSNNEILPNISKDSSFSFTKFFLKKTIYSKENYPPSLTHLSLSLSLSLMKTFPLMNTWLFLLLFASWYLQRLLMLPQNVLWDKRQSPSPKNIWVWVKAKGKGVSHCL
jgi:hypothetical protein